MTNPDSNSNDPYLNLGLKEGATFDEIQRARDTRLKEVADDAIAKAKVEAAYDALLMVSLKERQLGKVSNEAVNASQREETQLNKEGPFSLISKKLKSNESKSKVNSLGLFPRISFPENQGLSIRILFGVISILVLLISPPETIKLILSISTILCVIFQVRNGRPILASLGWSVVFLSLGLIIGGIIVEQSYVSSQINPLITKEQFEAIPPLLLLWIASFFIA